MWFCRAFADGTALSPSWTKSSFDCLLSSFLKTFLTFFIGPTVGRFHWNWKLMKMWFTVDEHNIFMQEDDHQWISSMTAQGDLPLYYISSMETAFAYAPIRIGSITSTNLQRNPLSISKLSKPMPQMITPRMMMQMTSSLELSPQSSQPQVFQNVATLTEWHVPEGDDLHRYAWPGCGTVTVCVTFHFENMLSHIL